jgi:short-subunit dehydrogenase
MLDAKSYGPWAIIAGASEEIGVSFAHQLGRAGINLILVARQKNLLEEVAREVCGESPVQVQVRVLPLDLTRTDVLDRVREVADEVEIGLIVLSAAASTGMGTFLDASLDVRTVEAKTVCLPYGD